MRSGSRWWSGRRASSAASSPIWIRAKGDVADFASIAATSYSSRRANATQNCTIKADLNITRSVFLQIYFSTRPVGGSVGNGVGGVEGALVGGDVGALEGLGVGLVDGCWIKVTI